jgi:hypothetical protein
VTDLPDPMTPADCNLRGLPFMPLQVVQLLDSDLFIKSTGDEFKAAVALWCKSWNQIPGGSLPDDDQILEALSCSKAWKKVKAMAMRGWVKCSDGRLYHPVVAQNALQAWEGREDHREVNENKKSRQQRWRERVKELSAELRDVGVTPPMNASLSDLERLKRLHVDGDASTKASTGDATETSTGDKPETAYKGQCKGQGITSGKGDKSPNELTKEELWKAGKSLLSEAGMPVAQCGSFVGKLVKDYTDAIVIDAVRAAVTASPADPKEYLKATCQRLAGERRSKKGGNPSTLELMEGAL